MNIKKIMNKGFTLIETLLVLTIIGAVTVTYMQYLKKDIEEVSAVQNGKQMLQMANSVNQYLILNYKALSDGEDTNCQPIGVFPCYINTSALTSSGLLPQSTTSAYLTSWGADYRIAVFKNASGSLESLIATTTPWILSGTDPARSLLGRALGEIGQDGGIVNVANNIDGYRGAWTQTSSNLRNDRASLPGTLVARAGSSSNLFEQFLKRDGSLPMTGDLNMGGKNITRVGAIDSEGNIFTTGKVSATDIEAANGIKASSLEAGSMVVGNMIADGATFNNQVITKGGIKNTGNIETDSLTANSLTLSGDLNLANVNASGNITAGGAVRGANGMFTGSVGADIVTATTINSEGLYVAGDSEVTGTSESGYLQAKNLAEVDRPCSTVGLIASTVDGKILSCQGGLWKAAGSGGVKTQYVTGPISACRGASIATCPTGKTLLSGGHMFRGSCGCSENQRFPINSYPSGNSWIVSVECAFNQAVAVCGD